MNNKYLVETIVVHRMRYIIEADKLEHAYDEVVCNKDITEFSQKYIDESIVSGRKVTDDEIKTMLIDCTNKVDPNEDCSYWMGLEYFINKIDYDS